MSPLKEKTAKAKPADRPRYCHFCRRDERLSLIRLIVGSEDRLVWACPSHRG